VEYRGSGVLVYSSKVYHLIECDLIQSTWSLYVMMYFVALGRTIPDTLLETWRLPTLGKHVQRAMQVGYMVLDGSMALCTMPACSTKTVLCPLGQADSESSTWW
jgi:hypothetical protein